DYPPDRPSASGSGYAAAAPRRLSRPRNGQALRLPDQRLSHFGQNQLRAVQRALAYRAVLQVDQTEPEDQSLCRDEPQRRNDPDLDRVVRQPLGGLFEVHQPVCVLRAAAPASAAAQPLCETKPLRTSLSTATAISPPEATPAGAALNLWDSSGSDPNFLQKTGSDPSFLGHTPDFVLAVGAAPSRQCASACQDLRASPFRIRRFTSSSGATTRRERSSRNRITRSTWRCSSTHVGATKPKCTPTC